MEKSMKSGYFSELAFHLRQEGFTVLAEEDGVLPVEWNGKPLYRVTEAGGIRYRQQDMADLDMVLALNRATDIASMTLEYMTLMADAPSLKADSLGENYKLLADFNGAVLAGHPTEYGVQFVTWEWSYGRTGLWQGHYHMNDYRGAKQDFAVRAGLIQSSQLFSNEQLAEIYRCVQETLESGYPITAERQRLLENVASQIEYGVPQLCELIKQSNLKETKAADEAEHQGMTQQM